MPLFLPRSLSNEHHQRKPVSCLRIVKLLLGGLPTIAFGVFTIIFTLQQNAASQAAREQDQQQADELNRRTLFKDYINSMNEMLLSDTFQTKTNKSLLLIQVRTLAVLQNLDAERKRDVILFLYRNGLLGSDGKYRVDLRGANLNGVRFAKSAAVSCDLTHLHLYGVDAENIIFDGCDLSRAVFRDSAMIGATFQSCFMERVKIFGVNLTRARFHDTELYESNFAGSTLVQSSIRGGILEKVQLDNVDLYQSDFDYDQLSSASAGLELITNTRLPNGSFTSINMNKSINHDHDAYKVRCNKTLSMTSVVSVTSVLPMAA